MIAHVTAYYARLCKTHKRYDCEVLRLICRRHLRTYSELHLNPVTCDVPMGTRWRAHRPEDTVLGGIHCDEQNFMTNSFTWLNMGSSPSQTTDFTTACEAVAASNGPARVALLIRPNRPMIITATLRFEGVKAHTIAELPARSIYLRGNHCMPQDGDLDSYLNSSPLSLVIVENDSAPPISRTAMHTDLNTALPLTKFSPPPWQKTSTEPLDVAPAGAPLLPRRPILNLPSLMWYRTDSPRYRPPKQDGKRQRLGLSQSQARQARITFQGGDSMHRTLGSLGATPRSLIPDLLGQVRNQRIIHPAAKEKVANIIYNGALEAYRRAEAWRKWRRKVCCTLN